MTEKSVVEATFLTLVKADISPLSASSVMSPHSASCARTVARKPIMSVLAVVIRSSSDAQLMLMLENPFASMTTKLARRPKSIRKTRQAVMMTAKRRRLSPWPTMKPPRLIRCEMRVTMGLST